MSLTTAARLLSAPLRSVSQPRAANASRAYAAAAQAVLSVLESELDAIRTAGTWKGERVITSQQGPRISVDGSRGGELHSRAKESIITQHHLWLIQQNGGMIRLCIPGGTYPRETVNSMLLC
uniref:Uncharacterized protein n=1 Tax=Sinocyclocheilus grahami TaxID=75366 RepID=A0A672MEL6_SINGR